MFLTHIIISNQQAEGRPLDFAACDPCDHSGRLSTDGDAIRCCQCLGQLIVAEAGRQLDRQPRDADQFAYIGAQDMAFERAAIIRASQALRP